MLARIRADRGSIASTVLIVVAAAAVLAAALAAEGFKTPELDLHDAGVWISRDGQGQVGRTNTQIAQVDVIVNKLGTEFELLQADEQVLVKQSAALVGIDARTALPSEPSLAIPGDARVSLGGRAGIEPTTAILSGTGQLWVGRGDDLLSKTLVSDDPDGDALEPTAEIAGATDVVVGTDGVVHVYAPAAAEVVSFDNDGVEIDRSSIGDAEESHDFELTAVGNTPVVLDVVDEVVLLAGGGEVDLSEHGGMPRLQDAGPDNDVAYVATNDRLIGVHLDGGSVEEYSTGGTGGATNPVFVQGCVWSAWNGQPSYASKCVGRDASDVKPLDGLTPGEPLRFRTNRGKVVINELESGQAYLLSDGSLDEITWAYAEEPDQDDPDAEDDNQREELDEEEDQQPPVAKDDTGRERFATRPDRTVVVDPLRNDSDPNQDVLVIESVDGVRPDGAVAQIVNGGLAVQVSPAPGSTDTVTFDYTINDGHVPETATASVEVVIRDPSENDAPECDRGEPQTTRVRAGASVVHNVLAEASDPDGDPIRLVVPLDLDSDLGTAGSDEDGTIVYRPPGVGFTGEVVLPYVIADDFGASSECTLVVTVLSEIEAEAPNEAPTARNDHAVTVVGREVVVDVLANDSDPDGDTLRVVGVDAFPGAEIVTDDQNRVHVTPTAPGVMNLEYSISDGPNEVVTATLRVDVLDDTGQEPPVAVRDDVILRPTVPAVVDVLANDTDINGDVLVVTSVDVPRDVPLAVEVVERQYLRISHSNGGLLEKTEQFTYTVTDGTSPVQGTVVVRPGATSSLDQPPDAIDDEFSVRAGTIAALEVLANDSDPEGGRIEVEFVDDEQEPGARGLAFVQRDLLRFRAPNEQGTYRLSYRARDQGGNTDAAFVTVHVLPAGVANKAPDAPDLIARGVAGRPVTIEIPVSTMDPDGDAVLLLGIGEDAPEHGSVTAVGADRLTYLPDRFDTDADGSPDGFFGTDVFTYRVRDTHPDGAESIGTIRVGVAPPPARNTRPVAIDDVRRVGKGGRLTVDVVRNDSDPDDDRLFIDEDAGLGVPPNAGFDAQIVDGRIVFDAGSLDDGVEASITYTVTDGILTDDGVLRVTVTEEGNLAPVALDDVHETTFAGDLVRVSVLDNDFDPDGDSDDLRVVEVSGAGDPSADGRGVEFTMPNESVSVVYTIEDGGGDRAQAVLRVPVADEVRRRPVALYDEATVDEGEEATVDVLANDLVSAGTEKVLFDVMLPRNGTCSHSGPEVTFTPNPGFVGLGGCTYLMGDGPGDAPETLRATSMFGVVVERSGNTPPTFVEQPLTLVADSEITRDMRFAAFDPDDGDEAKLTFDELDGETDVVSAAFDGSELTIRAAADAREGDVVTLTFTVTDPAGGEVRGSVVVTLERFTGALAVALPDAYETFEDVPTGPLELLANDQVAENGEALKIGGATTPTGGTLDIDDTTVVFTPSPGFFGQTTFIYTVVDGTGYKDREVTATVTITVIGRPDAPPAPSVDRQSEAIALSWGVPSPNGAPITEYRVKANGPAGEQVRTTASNTLVFDGLTNGTEYTFQIAAVNRAVTDGTGDLDYSPPSVGIVPNKKPEVPFAPLAEFTPDDTDGQSLTVSWENPSSRGVGTEVEEYLLEISPPPASGRAQQEFPASGPRERHQIIGLTNGVPYTFRVQAFNVIQDDIKGPSGWSAQSNAEVPATQPDTPLQPQVVEEGDNYIVVGWEEPPNNGDPIASYVVEFSQDGSVVGETARLPVTPRTVRIDTTNGSSYTFRVKAENKAGESGYSPPSAAASSYGVPGPTTAVSATEGDGNSTITVPGAPDQNGRPISSWQYRQATNGGAFPADPDAGWASLAGGPGSVVPAANGTMYQFQVRGCNARGCATDPGATSNAVRPFGNPGVPPNFSGSGNGTNSLRWNWNASNTNGHDSVAYQVSVNGGGWTAPSGATSHTISVGSDECRSVRARAVGNRTTPGGRTLSGTTASVQLCGPTPRVAISVGTSSTSPCWATGDTQGCYNIRIDMSGFGPGNHTVRCYSTMNSNTWQEFASFTAGNGVHNQCSYTLAGRWVAVTVNGTISGATWPTADGCRFADNNHSGTYSGCYGQWPTN